MKQIFQTLGLLIIAFTIGGVLASCDNSSGTNGGTAATTNPSDSSVKKMRIGVSVPAADHGWTAGVIYWAQKAMALHPEIEWQFQTAETGQKQVADIEAMMAKGIDGLVVLPQDVEPVTKAAKEAHDRGIFVVNIDRGLTQPVADLYLEGDNKAFGRKSAEYMVDRMGKKGNLVIITGKPCSVDTDRVNAAKAVFAQYPDIKIVAQQVGDWNRETALNVMQTILTQNPHIDAVWAQDDDMLLGAQKAIKDANRQGEMWILGGAGMKDVVKMVKAKDPMVPADMTYPPSMIAAGIHLAASMLRDGKQAQVSQFMPKHLTEDVELVTPENADGFIFEDSKY